MNTISVSKFGAAVLPILILSLESPVLASEGLSTRYKVKLERVGSPPLTIPGRRVAIRVSSRDQEKVGLAQKLQVLIETGLPRADNRFVIDAARPEATVDVDIIHDEMTARWDAREEPVTRTTGRGANGAPVSNTSNEIVCYLLLQYNFAAAYTIQDALGETTVDRGDLPYGATGQYRDGSGAPYAQRQLPPKPGECQEQDHSLGASLAGALLNPLTKHNRDLPRDLAGAAISQVADQIVRRLARPRESVEVLLPAGSFKDLAGLAEAGRWADYLKAVKAAPPFRNPTDESYRLYAQGVASEALGYGADEPAAGLTYLENAAEFYRQAVERNPAETGFKEAVGRKGSAPVERARAAMEDYRRFMNLAARRSGGEPAHTAVASNDAPMGEIEEYVQQRINMWQKKGEFEKTADYVERLKGREEKIRQYTAEAIAKHKEALLSGLNKSEWTLSEYDADRETFKIGIPRLGDVILAVPVEKGPAFKQSWPRLNFRKLEVLIANGKWLLSSMEIYDPAGGESYVYDSKLALGYDPASQFSFDFEPVQLSLPEAQVGQKFDDYNVERDIPRTQMSSPDAIAVVIGNTGYQKTKPVRFAVNDALSVKKYLIEALGFKDGNIFFVPNASKGDFESYFGSKDSPRGKLFNAVKPEKSDVFIYYSGHGAPSRKSEERSQGHEKDHRAYFVPVDCDPNYVEQGGYPLDTFYENLAKLPVRSVSVVLDACFSGADLFDSTSEIGVVVGSPSATLPHGAVLSSSSGTQVSAWYENKQHGMLTYFFLKGIHQRNADANKDGKLTFRELFDYLSDKTNGVPYWSRRIHGVEQDPTMQGTDTDRVLVQY